MVNLPNFTLRRQRSKGVEFLAAEKVFKPQREIRMTKDVTGWVTRSPLRKWTLAYGRQYAIDEDKAREFCIKGYAIPVGWEVIASDDERAEVLSNVTIIGLGG